MKPKIHFRRFEFKYVLSKNIADKIVPIFLQHMYYDPNLAKTKESFYTVNSLYYDSIGFGCYQEKVSGVSRRKKFRLRYYNNFDPNNNIFLEIKRKYDAVVVKDRVEMPQELAHDILSGKSFPENKNKTLEEFLFAKNYNSMKPMIMVSYRRKPLMGKNNEKLRVTFDYDIETWKTDWLDGKKERKRKVTSDELILEIKFDNSLPIWVYDIIQKYKLQRVAFSKYCFSLEKIYPNLVA